MIILRDYSLFGRFLSVYNLFLKASSEGRRNELCSEIYLFYYSFGSGDFALVPCCVINPAHSGALSPRPGWTCSLQHAAVRWAAGCKTSVKTSRCVDFMSVYLRCYFTGALSSHNITTASFQEILIIIYNRNNNKNLFNRSLLYIYW